MGSLSLENMPSLSMLSKHERPEKIYYHCVYLLTNISCGSLSSRSGSKTPVGLH